MNSSVKVGTTITKELIPGFRARWILLRNVQEHDGAEGSVYTLFRQCVTQTVQRLRQQLRK